MYQLGSQKSPPVPEAALKPDGHDFLKKCFIPDAKKRWKAIQLLGHNFVKVRTSITSHCAGFQPGEVGQGQKVINHLNIPLLKCALAKAFGLRLV